MVGLCVGTDGGIFARCTLLTRRDDRIPIGVLQPAQNCLMPSSTRERLQLFNRFWIYYNYHNYFGAEPRLAVIVLYPCFSSARSLSFVVPSSRRISAICPSKRRRRKAIHREMNVTSKLLLAVQLIIAGRSSKITRALDGSRGEAS